MRVDLAPIVLFVYNRPWHTRQCLESLEKNDLASESELYIYADGAKENATEDQLQKINEVRKLIREKKWCKEVHIVEQEKNKGLANSIIDGVTQVVNKYGKIIVLEDDLLLSKGFLKYMNESLNLYENENRVMQVVGYMFPVIEKFQETFFLPLTSSWGWAIWKRAWKEFHLSGQQLKEQISENKLIRIFNLDNSIDYYSMLSDQSKGSIDSWAILWYANVFLKRGLCLFPRKSLIHNIGHDGSGIHCSEIDLYHNNDLAKDIRVAKIKIATNELIYKDIIRYIKKKSSPSLFNRIIQRIKI